MIFRNTLFSLVLLSLLSSCALIKTKFNNLKNLSACSFELKDVKKKISFNEPTNNFWNYVITMQFNGINPNDENVNIGNYQLDLMVNNKLLTRMTSPSDICLNAQDSTSFEIKAIIAPNAALELLWKKLRNKRIEYRVHGTFFLRLGILEYPLHLKLFKYVENDE